MDRRTLITGVVLPFGCAGLFWLVGFEPSAVLFLFASIWVGRGMRWVAQRLRFPAGFAWPVSCYNVCSVGIVVGLWAWRMALSAPALSFLLGVCVFKLWVLFSLPLWSDRPWAYRLVATPAAYGLTVLGALAASVGVHAVLFDGSPVLALPLLAGVYLEFILLITASELL